MSSVDIRVELPSHSFSFHINVPHTCTVRSLKEHIQSSCPGSPSIEGQRVIWRGRFLKDNECVQDIWKLPGDSPVVHLSVNPSAWVTSPPSIPDQSPPTFRVPPQPPAPRITYSPPLSVFTPMTRLDPVPVHGLPIPYITHHHNNALHTLVHGKPAVFDYSLSDDASLPDAHAFAISVLHAHGLAWPRVLDEAYPPYDDSLQGISYEQVVIDNCPFLSLTTPDAVPTPCQVHALDVLRTTYALLSIPTPEITSRPSIPPQTAYHVTRNTNLNHHLQQLGIPALRLAPNQNPHQHPPNRNNQVLPDIRALPVRALLVPLMMLTVRTLLLVYFFSPSKRPLFGLILSAWIVYEAWNAFRLVIGNGARQDPNPARGAAVDAALRPGLGPNADPGAQAPATPGVGSNQNSRSHLNNLLDRFANFQLVREELALVGDPLNMIPIPTFFHRVKTFCALLFTTLHPAVWDRRRAILRRREGRMRGEASTRTTDTDSDNLSEAVAARAQLREMLTTRHQRRPAWVKDYIERVLATDWVDDL